MSSPQCTTESETVSSILFAHAADEELKNLVLPCLKAFPEICTAESGDEALRLYRARQPCMVVASLEQDDMTGFDLCARIREANPEVQIILVGRESGEAVYKGAMAAGAVRYLPIDDNVSESLKMLIDERFSLCEARRKERCEADMLRSRIAALMKNEEKLVALTIQRDSAFELIAMLDGDISDTAELKNLARFLSATAEPEARSFSLRALVSSLQSVLSQRHSPHGKEIFAMVPAYVPDYFHGNSSAIGRALSCLLGSAMENCDGGRITLKGDMKEKSCSGTVIQLSVEFNCLLTPKNRFASIREYLTDRSDAAQAPQMYGLSLAASLVERLGGEMWVKSLMNHSTTYYVSLCLPESPATVATDSDEALDQAAAAPGQDSFCMSAFSCATGTKATGRPRILLADDNEVDRLTICRLLESMDYDVIQVSNGLEAVEEFDGSSCDAVLMDILMPEMDGFEATRMIREKERLVGDGHTPIIALTSYSLKAIHEKCVSVGMDSYLHKPVSALEITRLFSSFIAGGPLSEVILNDRDFEQLPTLDIQDTLENLNNNADLYREIMDLFTANIPSDHQELLAAIRSGVLTNIVKNAHKIKGMAANVGAKRYAELAGQIQDAALDGDIGMPERWLHRLSVEMQRIQAAIEAVDWQKLH
jgi:CheY-like chemotaxis protein